MSERREAAGLHRTEVSFPRDRRDQMDALLASFNTTPKTLTYLLLPNNGGYLNRGALHRAVNQTIVGSNWEDGISDGTLADYCDDTLGPNGLVTTYSLVDFDSERKAGYGKASEPRGLAQRAALLTLKIEAETGRSLYPVFGQTSTPSERENRAPFTRAQILTYLSQQSTPVTQHEIIDMLVAEGIGPEVAQLSLRALRSSEAISYESVTSHTGKVQVDFTKGNLPIEQVQPYRHQVQLTQAAVETCERLLGEETPLTIKHIFDALPEEIKKEKNLKWLRHNLGAVITNLAEQGYLKRGKYKGTQKHSEASITDYGRTLVTDYLIPLAQLIDGNQETTQRVDEDVRIIRDNLREYAVPAINAFYRHSKSYKKANYERTLGVLEDFAAASMSHPEGEKGVTIDDLADFMGISKETIKRNMKKLTDDGKLIRIKVENVHRFFPAHSPIQ